MVGAGSRRRRRRRRRHSSSIVHHSSSIIHRLVHRRVAARAKDQRAKSGHDASPVVTSVESEHLPAAALCDVIPRVGAHLRRRLLRPVYPARPNHSAPTAARQCDPRHGRIDLCEREKSGAKIA